VKILQKVFLEGFILFTHTVDYSKARQLQSKRRHVRPLRPWQTLRTFSIQKTLVWRIFFFSWFRIY